MSFLRMKVIFNILFWASIFGSFLPAEKTEAKKRELRSSTCKEIASSLSIPLVWGLDQGGVWPPDQQKGNYYRGVELPAWYTFPRNFLQIAKFPADPQILIQNLNGEEGLAVVGVATQRFKRNSWAKFPDWMNERVLLAKKFKNRSVYVATRISDETDTATPSNTPTTIGVTWAKFKKSDIEGKSLAQLNREGKFNLPEEVSLNRQVSRYYTRGGEGIVIEIRANSKDPKGPEGVRQDSLVGIVNLVMKLVSNYPKLYKKSIITGPADLLHQRLYRRRDQLNMNVQTETTPFDKPAVIKNKKGKKLAWWIIESTPKNWEARLFNLKGFRVLDKLNQPHPFVLADGRKTFAPAQTTIAFDSQNRVTLATMGEELEFFHRLRLTPGTIVHWFEGKVINIYSRSEPIFLRFADLEYEIPGEAWLDFGTHDKFLEMLEGNLDARNFFKNDREEIPEVIKVFARMGSQLEIPGTKFRTPWIKFDLKRSTIEFEVFRSDWIDGMRPEVESQVVLRRENNQWKRVTSP